MTIYSPLTVTQSMAITANQNDIDADASGLTGPLVITLPQVKYVNIAFYSIITKTDTSANPVQIAANSADNAPINGSVGPLTTARARSGVRSPAMMLARRA